MFTFSFFLVPFAKVVEGKYVYSCLRIYAWPAFYHKFKKDYVNWKSLLFKIGFKHCQIKLFFHKPYIGPECGFYTNSSGQRRNCSLK